MPNFASVTLIGHLGRDPETRHTPGGESVTSFSLATSRKGRDGDQTTWWNCTAWGKRGETIAQWMNKGDPICVQGEPTLRPYTTRDGKDAVSLDVSVQTFTFVGGKDGGRGAGPAAPRDGGRAPAGGQAPAGAPFDDDIPF